MEDFSRGRPDKAFRPRRRWCDNARLRRAKALRQALLRPRMTLVDIRPQCDSGPRYDVPSADSPTMVDMPSDSSSDSPTMVDIPSQMGDSPAMVGTSPVPGKPPAWKEFRQSR
jgi:hypothetical protein